MLMSKAEQGRPSTPEPLPSPVVDSHCHLDVVDRHLKGSDEELGVEAALARAASVNVTRVVQVGCDVASSRWAVSVAEEFDSVIAAVAIHPNDAARVGNLDGVPALDAQIDEIESLLVNPCVRAVGETGLDYFRTGDDGKPAQQHSFRRHINLAKKYDRTLVIHDRDSHDDVIAILREEGAPNRVVFHCFSGDVAMARICADNGWWCSFAGVVTFPSAEQLREALIVLPRELLLVETDAPYLTPAPHRGRVNASYLIPHTVEMMSATRGESIEELCSALWDNSMRAFGVW
ncbi:MAG: TatD family hydrolase [Candidatus Nanopelagicales bacterium]